MDLIQDARRDSGSSLGSTLVRLAGVAAAAHRFEAAGHAREQACQSNASGRQAEGQSGTDDKDVASTRGCSFREPSSIRTEVGR